MTRVSESIHCVVGCGNRTNGQIMKLEWFEERCSYLL